MDGRPFGKSDVIPQMDAVHDEGAVVVDREELFARFRGKTHVRDRARGIARVGDVGRLGRVVLPCLPGLGAGARQQSDEGERQEVGQRTTDHGCENVGHDRPPYRF